MKFVTFQSINQSINHSLFQTQQVHRSIKNYARNTL